MLRNFYLINNAIFHWKSFEIIYMSVITIKSNIIFLDILKIQKKKHSVGITSGIIENSSDFNHESKVTILQSNFAQ